MSKKQTLRELSNLCQCSKYGYGNGEKKLFSGYMGVWHKYETTYMDKEKMIVHLFPYKQKKILNWSKFESDWQLKKQLPTIKERKEYLIKGGHFYYPCFSYNCAFMVGAITEFESRDEMLFMWYSGDDDLHNNFRFPKDKLNKVKVFIKENHQDINFQSILENFILDNLENGFTFN